MEAETMKIQEDFDSLKKTMETIKKQLERLIKLQEEKRRRSENPMKMEKGKMHPTGQELEVSCFFTKERKSEIPIFNGTDPKGWIIQMEKYFALKCLNNEEKLEVSASSFEEDALRWFQWEHQRRPFKRWDDLKSMILRQFCSSGEWFLTLKQGVTMNRDITEKNLQEEKRENIDRRKEGVDKRKRDRETVTVGFVDNSLEPLPKMFLSSPPPPLQSPPLVPSSLSPSVNVTKSVEKTSTIGSGILFRRERVQGSSKPNLVTSSKPNLAIRPKSNPIVLNCTKTSLMVLICPKLVPNVNVALSSTTSVSSTVNGDNWLGCDHQKLPQPPPCSDSSSLNHLVPCLMELEDERLSYRMNLFSGQVSVHSTNIMEGMLKHRLWEIFNDCKMGNYAIFQTNSNSGDKTNHLSYFKVGYYVFSMGEWWDDDHWKLPPPWPPPLQLSSILPSLLLPLSLPSTVTDVNCWIELQFDFFPP